jgi:Leucine-rich repeat (LRR) protein
MFNSRDIGSNAHQPIKYPKQTHILDFFHAFVTNAKHGQGTKKKKRLSLSAPFFWGRGELLHDTNHKTPKETMVLWIDIPSVVVARILCGLTMCDHASAARVSRRMHESSLLASSLPTSVTLYTNKTDDRFGRQRLVSMLKLDSVRIAPGVQSPTSLTEIVTSLRYLTSLDVPFEVDPAQCGSRSTLTRLRVRRADREGLLCYNDKRVTDLSGFSALTELDSENGCETGPFPDTLLRFRGVFSHRRLHEGTELSCPRLTSLDISCNYVCNIRHVSCLFPQLIHLSCNFSSRLPSTVATTLPVLSSIKTLRTCAAYDTAVYDAIRDIPSLQSLHITLESHDQTLTNTSMRALSQFTHIRHLHVHVEHRATQRISNIDLSDFTTSSVLTSFIIRGNYKCITNSNHLPFLDAVQTSEAI